jgi:hypothetical protein
MLRDNRNMASNGLSSSALIEAIRAGSLSGVISALEGGEDIEMPDMHGYLGLPLRTACFSGNPAIVRELLSRGAKPDAIASDGPGAPLRLALRNGHQEIVDLLLNHGTAAPAQVTPPPQTEDSSFGTDTGLLSMDLLFMDEDDADGHPPQETGKR